MFSGSLGGTGTDDLQKACYCVTVNVDVELVVTLQVKIYIFILYDSCDLTLYKVQSL